MTEPLRRAAIHGLVAWMPFDLVASGGTSVWLRATIAVPPGYPWRARLDVHILVDQRDRAGPALIHVAMRGGTVVRWRAIANFYALRVSGESLPHS